MDVTLIYNGVDFSPVLSTYKVEHQTEYGKVVTTLDHTEHVTPAVHRPVIIFSLFPMTDVQAASYYTALRQSIGNATYTDTFLGDRTSQFRVVTNIDAVFGLRSCDGNRYWKGGEIQLRATHTV